MATGLKVYSHVRRTLARPFSLGFSPSFATAAATRPAVRRPIRIVEVGPRDGLQNEKRPLSNSIKVDLISRLARAGLRNIEAGSFVSPKWVPQMAGTADILGSDDFNRLNELEGIHFPVLVPNAKGLENLLSILEKGPPEARPTDEIAIFTAATESFAKANTNATIAESLERLSHVTLRAKDAGLRVRGYVSCVVGCPYEGTVDPRQVASVTKALLDMGCYEVSLGDTVGVGTPRTLEEMLNVVARQTPIERLAAHCHDTYGTGVGNVLAMVKLGVPTVDSSIGGLGGCPYSPGATGNVATEDVVYALEGEGYDTGIVDHDKKPEEGWTPRTLSWAIEDLAAIGDWISRELGRENASRAGRASLAQRERRVGKEAKSST